MRKRGKFIDEQELLNQWQLWVDSAQRVEDRVMPDMLVDLLYTVADHLLEHPRFVRYSYSMKQDMRQEAVIKALKNLKNFKPEKGKLFSYLTTCCWTAFVIHLAKYYKELNKKRDLLTDALVEAQSRNDIRQSEAMRLLLQNLEEWQNEQSSKKGDEEP